MIIIVLCLYRDSLWGARAPPRGYATDTKVFDPMSVYDIIIFLYLIHVLYNLYTPFDR